ncbi:MAG: hypothetical protein WBB25_19960 [Sulfitobacter sp.]
MSRISVSRFSLALPAMLLSQAAYADVTAAQVWGDWKLYMQNMGYEISATETTNGDDITVEGLSMALEMPDSAGQMSLTTGTITFAQNGGAVDIVMPAALPVTIAVTPKGGGNEPVTMNFNFSQSGHSLTASGVPEEMVYTYGADSFGVVLEQLQADGGSFGPENAKVNVSGTGVSSSTTMKIGELRTYVQSSVIESLVYDIAIDNPKDPVKVKLNGGIDGVAFDGGGSIPLTMVNSSDMATMLKAGFAIKGMFTYGSGTMQMNVADPANGDFAATTASDGGALSVEMNDKLLAYSGGQNNVKMNLNVANLPFPVDLSMAKAAFNLMMPISASEDPQDFAFGITLGDFVISDMIWSIFDPTSKLPRDPATVELDLTGQAKLLVDVIDPEAAASAAVPGELQALTVKNVLVDAVGAKLEGSGDFTFDNTDMTTFPGMPKPVGAVNLALAGGNGLIDKLVSMGLLPEQQAMGARMMMGLFAVPGDAPDTLKSKVEFTEDGQVLANGQRIK